MISDSHLHSRFSSDSDEKPENIIKTCIKKGMKTMCITDHMDLDYDITEVGLDFLLDIPSYSDTWQKLKDLYKKDINIHMGIELGLQPHLTKRNTLITKEAPFDMVIGSIHLIEKKDPYYDSFWIDRDIDKTIELYFQEMLTCAKAFDEFDILGHIDYLLRYVPKDRPRKDTSHFMDIIEEILKVIIHKGKGIELNTAGFRYGMGHPNPSEDIISLYKKLGGEIITVGSDAHKASDIGSHFEKASDILKDLGFKYYSVFKNRKASFMKL